MVVNLSLRTFAGAGSAEGKDGDDSCEGTAVKKKRRVDLAAAKGDILRPHEVTVAIALRAELLATEPPGTGVTPFAHVVDYAIWL